VRFGLARFDDRTTRPFAVVIDHGAVIDPERRERGAWAVLVGDTEALGYSQTYRRPVWELLFGEAPTLANRGLRADGSASLAWRISHFGRVQNTALLMGPAMLLAALLAIVLGALAAANPRGKIDRLVGALAIAGVSLPSFWIGIMGVVVFAGVLGWLPAGGAQTPGLADELGVVLADRARHAVLPTLVLALVYAGQWLRYVRAGVLETVSLEFVRTARAKGASRARVLAHALRAALLPFVTVVALSVPAVFSGAALTEIVFSWPGVGRLQYDAIQHNDSYVAIVVFLVSATLVMLGSLAADLLYGVLDPRLRRRGAR
jgi:peptide/nickel transport system permease protein